MPRISTYTKDATIVDEDILLGSNYVRTYNGIKEYNTRSFKLEDLALYFNTKFTSASIDTNSITATELNISGNGSSGQFIMSDGDGSFSYLSILDEDNMSSNSATAPASQQSIKAYVDSQIATEDTIAELNDTTIGTLANAHLLIYDNDSSVWENKALSGDATITKEGVISLASSHTNIDSILNASLAVGRDADNQIKYSTDNQIIFRVDGGDNVFFKGSGEIEASSLDISGDIDIDGTTNLDAVDIDGAVQIDNTVTIGVDDTGYDVKFFGATASKYLLWDASDDKLIATGEIEAGSLDISGDADIDGTLEADAITVDGTALNEYIADTTGAMFTSNTETFISATYEDGDNTIDLVVPVKDEDNMASDSATHLATQQSIKAYVDAQVDTEDTLAELDDTNISSAAAGQILVYDNTASVWDNVALTAGDLIDVTGGDGTLEIDVDLTEAAEAAIANGDYMLFLDGGATGTPKKEALHDIATLFSGTGLTATNSVIAVDAAQTQITSVGTLAAGAISSGFGNIDNGSSTFNTGAATVDSLSVSDGNITNVGDIALDTISADGTTINVAMTDNTDGAFSVKQGSDKYIAIDTTDTGEDIAIGTGVSGTAITIGHTTSETTIQDNLTVTGNLKVNGDQVYQNVTSMAVSDPIISLQTGTDGANLGADSNKDVGLAMFWHNGSAAKTAFLGFDDSAGKLTFIPDASISSEVASGSVGIMVANLEGDVTGDVTGTATNASHVLVTDNESTNEENLITFVEGAKSSTGNVGLEMDGNLTYNPSTGTVTATGFSGNLTGTLQTAAQANVTSLGTLSTLTVDNVIINATNIGHTSDTDLLTLASGALTVLGTITVGVDDTGHDVKFFGATSGKYMMWDEALDALFLPDDTKLLLGTGSDASIYVSSDDLYIDQSTGDKDIIFKGTDGSSDITALTLDMSDAGTATFNHDIKLTQTASTSSNIEGDRTDSQFTIKGGSAGAGVQLFGSTYTNYAGALYLDATASSTGTNDAKIIMRTGSSPTTALTLDRSQNATFAGTVTSGDITIGDDDTPSINFKKSSTADVIGLINVSTDAGTGGKMVFQTKRNGDTAQDALTIDDGQDATFAGSVGIGTAPGSYMLHLNGTGDAIRVESTNAGSGGAQMDLMHYSGSPADEDIHGFINFGGYYTGTTVATGSQIRSYWTDVSDRHGRLEFWTADTTTAVALTLAHDKSATFAGSVTTTSVKATNFMNVMADDAEIYWTIAANNDYWRWRRDASDNFILDHYNGSGTGTALSFDGSQNATFGEHVSLPDSKELRFGTGTDANIRHDGNNTKFSHTGSGGLYIGADTIGLQSGDHSSYTSATFTSSGTTLGTGTVAAANAAADDFVIKGPGTTATGMTISNTTDSGTGTIFFGDTTSSSVAGFRYNHNTGDMAISAEDDINFTCDHASFSGDVTMNGDVNVNLNDTAAEFTIISADGQYDDSDDADSVFALKYYGQSEFHTHRVGSSWNSIMENPHSSGSYDFWINGASALELTNGRNTHVKGTLTVNGTDNVINTGNSGNFDTNDALDYPRITLSGASAQLGLFRSGSAVGGAYVGGDSSGFKVRTADLSSTTFHVDTSGNTMPGQYLWVNTTATIDSEWLAVKNTTSGTYACIGAWNNATSGTVEMINFYTESSATARGQIVYSNSSGDIQIDQLSDRSLKENIKDLDGGLKLIGSLKPRIFDFKDEESGKKGVKNKAGFIAQEVEEVKPEWVNEKKGLKTLPGNLTGGVVPYLIKAIQELEARVKELENK